MDRTRFIVRFKDGRIASEATDWVEPLDQLIRSDEVLCGWLELESPYAVDLEELQQAFGFNAHAIEDCRQFDQRAKLEGFENHSFWVCHGSQIQGSADGTDGLKFSEVHAFLTGRWCVTVHQGGVEPIDKLMETWVRMGFPQSPALVWGQLMNGLIDQNERTRQALTEKLDQLDEEIGGGLKQGFFKQGLNEGQIERIHGLRMAFKGLRRLMAPQVEYLRSTSEGRGLLGEALSPGDRVRFRAIKDHAQVLVEKVDLSIEQAHSLRDAYAVVANIQSNRTISRLTLLSVLFLPLNFLTGFFGMNFSGIPYGDSRLLLTVIAGVLLIPSAAYLGWRVTRRP